MFTIANKVKLVPTCIELQILLAQPTESLAVLDSRSSFFLAFEVAPHLHMAPRSDKPLFDISD